MCWLLGVFVEHWTFYNVNIGLEGFPKYAFLVNKCCLAKARIFNGANVYYLVYMDSVWGFAFVIP